MKNIVFIGMPGAGKSTIGVLLAKSLKMPFIDTDLLIQQCKDKFLQEIIEEQGIEAFLDIEQEVIIGMKDQGSIVATGGSVVYREKAMEHLKANGLIVYLELPLKVIEQRLHNIKTRGIAMSKTQTLSEVYHERVALYEKYSDITIRCNEKSMESIVDEIHKIITMT